jgi:hypothetical protein
MTIYRNPNAPTFIIEGSGGCDYFVEREACNSWSISVPLEPYTDAQFVNTGFSILTSFSEYKFIQNDHYLGKDGSIGDSFAIEVLDE